MKIAYEIMNESSVRQWFREHYMNLTYSELQKHLRLKNITLNGKKIHPQHNLLPGSILHVWDKIPKINYLHAGRSSEILDTQSIILETADMLVINKPYNVCSQGSKHNSLFLQAEHYAYQRNKKAYPVHRLDKLTTGVLIFALNRQTAMDLSNSISTWRKTYLALLPKNNLSNDTIITYEDGKKLITHYTTIGQIEINGKAYTMMKFVPQTGKKHQIRKHAAHLGYPIIGDNKYNNTQNIDHNKLLNKNEQQMHLHCYAISFTLQEKEYKLKAKLPEHMNYFANYLNKLEN